MQPAGNETVCSAWNELQVSLSVTFDGLFTRDQKSKLDLFWDKVAEMPLKVDQGRGLLNFAIASDLESRSLAMAKFNRPHITLLVVIVHCVYLVSFVRYATSNNVVIMG